jgi:hypothetical protein
MRQFVVGKKPQFREKDTTSPVTPENGSDKDSYMWDDNDMMWKLDSKENFSKL